MLELMLVMTILALMTAMVSPVFSGTFSSLRSEDGVRTLVETMEFAQSRAVTDAHEYRLYLASKGGQYWVERIGEKEDTIDSVEDSLPDSLRFTKAKAQRDEKSKRYYIAFYPSGLCDRSSISLADQESRYLISTTGTRIKWSKAST